LIVSDFAAAEFASATARRVRMREVTVEQARVDLSDFDGWVARSAQQVNVLAADIAMAATYLRRFEPAVRTPAAIHIAIARRLDATLATFDRQMSTAARALGIPVVTL
jgi:predicted nucleic acid-binding protein